MTAVWSKAWQAGCASLLRTHMQHMPSGHSGALLMQLCAQADRRQSCKALQCRIRLHSATQPAGQHDKQPGRTDAAASAQAKAESPCWTTRQWEPQADLQDLRASVQVSAGVAHVAHHQLPAVEGCQCSSGARLLQSHLLGELTEQACLASHSLPMHGGSITSISRCARREQAEQHARHASYEASTICTAWQLA